MIYDTRDANVLTGVKIKKGYSPYVDEDTGTWWEYDSEAKEYADTEILAEVKSPYVNTTTGNWMVFNHNTKAFVDTGILANGRSPYVNTTTDTWWQYNDTTRTYVDTGIKSGKTYATSAENAMTAAQQSQTAAANSATSASNSKTAAANSATSAAGSATAASTSATNASNSATAAANSATSASTSATNASTSATNAAGSATSAANSASSIAASASQISTNKTDIESLKNDLVDLENRYSITKSFNRWNPNDVTVGRIDVSTGGIDTTFTYASVSDFIEVTDIYACATVTQDDGTNPTITYDRIAQYKADKTFIRSSYGGTTPILLDTDCKYVRVCMQNTQRNISVYFSDDGAAVAYTPYSADVIKLKSEYLPTISEGSTSFNGKKMCSFGDSITAHGTWQDTVKNMLGLSAWQNCGISGSMISGSGDAQFNSNARINAIDESCDFIVIMGGVNDAVGRAVGEQTLDNHSMYQVFGALNVIISKIMYKAKINEGLFSDVDYTGVTRFSNRKEFPIFLCTQPMHVNQTTINEELFEDIENAIRKCGELWGIPVIDVNKLSRLNKANMGNTYYSSDGLHPNANGGKLLGMCIGSGLKRNEPYFG